MDPLGDATAPFVATLSAEEPIFRSAVGRLAPSPTGPTSLGGVVVLTAAQISFVPVEGSPEPSSDPVRLLLGELWQLVRPALLEAFPVAQLIAARQGAARQNLAGRGRSGIEIPLQMLEGVFCAGSAPGWLGLKIALPPPDPRPPFTLYLDLGAQADEWLPVTESARSTAAPRPDLERPYALYYLFRRLPSPIVLCTSEKGPIGRGRLLLTPDGPALHRRPRDPFLPYETVESVGVVAGSSWRRGWVELRATDQVFRVDSPRSDQRRLEDCAHLVAELAGAPLTRATGPLAGSRIAFRAAWAAAAGAGLVEIARHIFF